MCLVRRNTKVNISCMLEKSMAQSPSFVFQLPSSKNMCIRERYLDIIFIRCFLFSWTPGRYGMGFLEKRNTQELDSVLKMSTRPTQNEIFPTLWYDG